MRSLVQRASGKVIVLVHPFYEVNATKAYHQLLGKVLQQTKTPIVILEEYSAVDALKRRLHKISENASHLIIPTDLGDHRIVLRRSNTVVGDPNQHSLIHLLQKAGVTTVLLSGAYALKPVDAKAQAKKNVRVGREESLPLEISKGCAGETCKNLVIQGNFDKVQWITPLMHGDKPAYADKRRK